MNRARIPIIPGVRARRILCFIRENILALVGRWFSAQLRKKKKKTKQGIFASGRKYFESMLNVAGASPKVSNPFVTFCGPSPFLDVIPHIGGGVVLDLPRMFSLAPPPL